MNGTVPQIQFRVGGTVQEVEPVRYFHAKDRLAIMALLLFASIIHGVIFWRTIIPARDGLSFSRLAIQIKNPNSIAMPGLEKPTIVDVLQQAEQAPGFPLAMLSIYKFVTLAKPITEETGNLNLAQQGDRMLISGQLICCICGGLTVLPMYLMGRMLAGRFVGFAGAILFQALPVAAHVTSDCLSEGCYLLLLTTSLWLSARGLRRTGLGNFLLAGFFVGLTYLVRPEGLLVVMATSSLIVIQAIRSWPRGQAIACLLAMLVGVSLVAGPYMMMIGGISNKPSEKEFFRRIFGNPREKLLVNEAIGLAPMNQSPALFGEWLTDTTKAGRAFFAVKAVVNETAKSSFFIVGFLAVMGVVAMRKRILQDPAAGLFVMYGVMNATLLMLFAAKIGYISERHTLPLVSIICLFAAASLQPLFKQLAVYTPMIKPAVARWLMVLAILAVAVPIAVRQPHASRIGLKKAGEFLATVYKPEDVIVDPFSWSEFYAGAAVTRLANQSETAKVLYTVLPGPADKSSHDRLPKIPLAKEIATSGQKIYQWPEDVPVEEAKVMVYKTVR